MLVLEWNNPRITVNDLDFYIRNYLGDIFDGLVIQDSKLYVQTFEVLTPEQEDYIRDYFYTVNDVPRDVSVVQAAPFAAKCCSMYKYFKRVHGVQQAVSVGQNTIDFTVPYDWVKITGIECVGCENLDIVNLYIVHPTLGVLNQFGYNVNMRDAFYTRPSEYDADLYLGLIVRAVYTSISAKTIGINYILNEVVAK